MSAHDGANLAPAHLLDVQDLSVFYGRFQALHGISVTLAPGEIVSIIGANGAGKSSLIKAIVGQAPRAGGTIHFDGRDVAAMSTPEIVAAGVALVPEGRRLFAGLSVEENLRIGRHAGRKDTSLEQVFAMFPALRERRKHRAHQLSGGQQQMVAIGRAILAGPRLMLCDEISLGLAPIVVEQMYSALSVLRDAGIALLLVEQDVRRSLAVADRFYCLLEGRITLSGRPSDHPLTTIMDSYFGVRVGHA